MGIGVGAELLMLPLGAMLVLAVVAIFAAFFNRSVAKACAAFVWGLAALFLLVVFSMNDWNLGWVLRLHLEVLAPFVILYCFLLLTAIAFWTPLRRPDSAGPDGGRIAGRPRWILFALALGVVAAAITLWSLHLEEGRNGEKKAQALLAGNAVIQLKRIQIDYQQRRLICTDPKILRYLEERFRRHEPEPHYLGVTYELTLSYEGGGTQSFASYWTDAGDINLFLGEPGEGGRGHGIRLTRPRPQGVDEMVEFLAKPHGEVAGIVMILDADGIRTTRDGSLVAR